MNRFELSAGYAGFELLAKAEWAADSAALFGASGAGKTTILEALCGLRPEATGSVVLRDRRIDGLPPKERGLGWVPQDAALFPHMTARENIDFAVRLRGSETAARDAIEALELGILLDRRAPELSGGERQRVAIARALASRPEFLLLDEPLASLDRPLRMRVLPFLAGLPARLGVPVLIVTHDPLEVLALARHVLVLEAGRIVTAGDPHSVFASAATFGALQALGAENRFDVRVLERRKGTLQVETGAGTVLSMVRVEGFREPSRVAIRSEDIMLAAGDPGRVSAQNVLPARVVGLESVGEQVYVELEVRGELWRAKVTTGAVQDLGIRAGSELVMLVKAHAILGVGE